MPDSVRGLARDLKQFLKTAAVEDLISTSAAVVSVTQASAAPKSVSAGRAVRGTKTPAQQIPKMAPGSTLDVSFARKEDSSLKIADKTAALNQLADTIKNCQRCPLGATRLNVVPGEGNVNATVIDSSGEDLTLVYEANDCNMQNNKIVCNGKEVPAAKYN